MYYYFLVDGSISILGFFPPFFSFVLKYLLYFLYFAGLEQLPKVSLGSTYVFSLAYISSYVLIINFFLLAFFWFSVEPTNFEISSEPIEILIEELTPAKNNKCPFIFAPGEEKPFLFTYVEEIGIDEFYRRIDNLPKISSFEEIENIN